MSKNLGFGAIGLSSAILALTVLACGGDDAVNPPTDAGTDTGAPDSGAPQDSGSAGCTVVAPTKSGADCVLPANVTSSMTIGTECQPWNIAALGTTVGDPANKPILTIQPCVNVVVAPGGFLNASGSGTGPGGIVANGTAQAPIAFTSGAATPAAGDWGGISFSDKTLATSSLSGVSVAYAGGAFGTAALNGNNGAVTVDSTTDVNFLFSTITISDNAGDGFRFTGGAQKGVGFANGSGNLTIKSWGAANSPIVLTGGDPVATLPTTLTTGASGHDGQVDLLVGGTIGGAVSLDTTETWPAIPIPYLVDGQLAITGGTLTIAAPNTLQFKTKGIVTVDFNQKATGFLVANGTATSPIVFTSNASSPQPAAWEGIQYFVTPTGQATSVLNFVTIEYAGGTLTGGNSDPNGCGAAFAAVAIDQVGPINPGSGPVITNTTIKGLDATDDGMNVIGTLPNRATYTAAASNNTFTGALLAVCPTH